MNREIRSRMDAMCSCGHKQNQHDATYSYCRAAVTPPIEQVGVQLGAWPCQCRGFQLQVGDA